MRPKALLNPRRWLTPDLFIILSLFLFAFALRVYGVRGSLPYVGHPDEPKLINSAVHIVKTGDLNPHLYIWPSLYIYFEALVTRLHTTWGTLRGYYQGSQSLPDISHIFALAPGVYVWTRVLTAFIGAATCALLFVVGRAMFNGSRRVGVVAALLLAVSPLHIEYSHYALTDVPLAFMGLLVLWASYALSRTRRSYGGRDLAWTALLCGLLVGLATGTKYNGLYLMIVPLTAWAMLWFRRRRGPLPNTENPPLVSRSLLRALAFIPVGAIVGFLLAEPYALLDWPSFYSGFTFQVGAYEPARNIAEAWASVERHITDLSASDAYFFMPAALGAILLIANPPVRNRAWLLIPFPVFYLLAMSRFSLTYVRNLLVTLPFLALMSGYAVDLVATQLSSMARNSLPGLPWVNVRALWGAVRWALVAILVAFIVWEPLRVSSAYSMYMADPESRNLAWDWMRTEMGDGARFAAELHPWQTQDWPDVLSFDVENPESASPLTMRPPSWYASHGYNYVVLNSNYRDSERDPAFLTEYRALPVAKEFPGDKEGGKGPNITVYATGAPTSTLPVVQASTATLEDFARLEGYDLRPLTSTNVLLDPASTSAPEDAYKAGQAIGLNLYYRALRDGRPTDPNWQVWVHLIDPPSGATVAQVDVPPLTGQLKDYPNVVQQPHPVSQWHQGELLAGVYNFNLPANLPPGTYRLETGMWVPPNGPGAKVTNAASPDHVELAQIAVR